MKKSLAAAIVAIIDSSVVQTASLLQVYRTIILNDICLIFLNVSRSLYSQIEAAEFSLMLLSALLDFDDGLPTLVFPNTTLSVNRMAPAY